MCLWLSLYRITRYSLSEIEPYRRFYDNCGRDIGHNYITSFDCSWTHNTINVDVKLSSRDIRYASKSCKSFICFKHLTIMRTSQVSHYKRKEKIQQRNEVNTKCILYTISMKNMVRNRSEKFGELMKTFLFFFLGKNELKPFFNVILHDTWDQLQVAWRFIYQFLCIRPQNMTIKLRKRKNVRNREKKKSFTSFKINFLLNVGLLNSVKLPSENISINPVNSSCCGYFDRTVLLYMSSHLCGFFFFCNRSISANKLQHEVHQL